MDLDWEGISESIPQMAWVGAPDGATQYVNKRTREYTGRSLEAHQGWEWVQLVHPDDAQKAREGWESAVLAEKGYDSEFRIRRFDGEYRWHCLRASPMRGNDGHIERWIGTVTDIEAPRRIERALVEAVDAGEQVDALLSTLQAAAPVALGFVDSDLRVVQANDELAGIDRQATAGIGKPISEALPILWSQIEVACRRVLESGETVGGIAVVGGASGDEQNVHNWLASCYAVKADDEVIGAGIVAVDVTELSQATEFRSAVLSRVADGVLVVGADGQLVHMNAAASQMLGWSQADFAGRLVHDVLHFQDKDGTPIPFAECQITAAGMGLSPDPGHDNVFTRKDGSVFPIDCSVVPLGVGTNKRGFVVVFREATEPRVDDDAIRVLLIDSHPVVTDAFVMLLGAEEGLDLVATASTSTEGVAEAERLAPDVVLVDADLPDRDGIATARLISDAVADANVILVTQSYDSDAVEAALEAGCAAVVDRTHAFRDVVSAVRAVHEGRTILSKRELDSVLPARPARRRDAIEFLTPREREVLSCISEGLSNRAVADRLGVTANTVRNHVQRVLFKLNVHSKLEAIVFARPQPPEPVD